jgi:hypothetical protein
MLDMPMRLVVAYGLIAAMLLIATAIAWWSRYNSRERREVRSRARQAEIYRVRDETAAERPALSER